VILLLLNIPPHWVKCQVSYKQTKHKTTSVTAHFKKLTTGNNVFSVSVSVWSNCHILHFYIKCSMCPHCCWTTHSNRRLQ